MLNRLIIILLLGTFFWVEGRYPHFRGRFDRLDHAISNLLIAALNGLLGIVFFAELTLRTIDWAEMNSFGLLRLIDIGTYKEGIAAFLLFDLWMYSWHVVNHRIPLLWRFHRLHHSDLEMDTTTALRFHPGEIIFSSLLRLVVIPVLGMSFLHLLIHELLLYTIILFHHSNIGLYEKWDRMMRVFIVTPNMHRVHHSQEWDETNSNYSSVLSIWDRLFRTFRKRDDTLTIRFGLMIFQESKWQRLRGMLITPFR